MAEPLDVKMDKRLMRRVLRDRQLERVLVKRARPIADRLESITYRRTGRTAGSTRIEVGHRNATGDRVAVRISQTYGAAAMNFRTRRRYMLEAL